MMANVNLCKYRKLFLICLNGKHLTKLIRLAAAMRQTLADMAATESASIVAVTCGVANLFDGFCEFIGGYVVDKWKMISAIAVVFASVQATVIFDPVKASLPFN